MTPQLIFIREEKKEIYRLYQRMEICISKASLFILQYYSIEYSAALDAKAASGEEIGVLSVGTDAREVDAVFVESCMEEL